MYLVTKKATVIEYNICLSKTQKREIINIQRQTYNSQNNSLYTQILNKKS